MTTRDRKGNLHDESSGRFAPKGQGVPGARAALVEMPSPPELEDELVYDGPDDNFDDFHCTEFDELNAAQRAVLKVVLYGMGKRERKATALNTAQAIDDFDEMKKRVRESLGLFRSRLRRGAATDLASNGVERFNGILVRQRLDRAKRGEEAPEGQTAEGAGNGGESTEGAALSKLDEIASSPDPKLAVGKFLLENGQVVKVLNPSPVRVSLAFTRLFLVSGKAGVAADKWARSALWSARIPYSTYQSALAKYSRHEATGRRVRQLQYEERQSVVEQNRAIRARNAEKKAAYRAAVAEREEAIVERDARAFMEERRQARTPEDLGLHRDDDPRRAS